MEVVIDNLAALGFSDASLSLKSFDVRNLKLFEKVVYHLVTLVRPGAIQTWPVLSRKDELPFRKEVVEFIKSLDNPRFPPIEMTTLLPNPGGTKCINFLLRFSQFVLETKIAALDAFWESPFSRDCDVALMQGKLLTLSQFYESQLLSRLG